MAMGKELSDLKGSALAVVGLSGTVLTGLAIVTGFKNTGLIDNTTADQFITGLAIFGGFVGVIVLALMGKVIVGLFKTSN